MNVTILYFDGCPNWQQAHARVLQALREVGATKEVLTLRRVETEEQAHEQSFRGSPTVLVNGRDPFADLSASVGLACRVYPTATGPAVAPSVEQLTAALRRAR